MSWKVWKYGVADWEALNDVFAHTDWKELIAGDISLAVERTSSYILEKATNFIPQKLCTEFKGNIDGSMKNRDQPLTGKTALNSS